MASISELPDTKFLLNFIPTAGVEANLSHQLKIISRMVVYVVLANAMRKLFNFQLIKPLGL